MRRRSQRRSRTVISPLWRQVPPNTRSYGWRCAPVTCALLQCWCLLLRCFITSARRDLYNA